MTWSMLDSRQTDRSVSLAGIGILAYGIGSYLLGVTALGAVILVSLGVYAFTGVPVHIANPIGAALFNVGLLVLFGLQHSLMARAGFKRRWTRIIPPAMERSTFVLATGLVLLPLVALWQPLPTTIWSVDAPLARETVRVVALLGWAYLFLATFAIDHFELFGLQQSWRGFRNQPPVAVPFRERWMYRFDRHPIMTGVLVGLWATPDMTVGRLLFVGGLSAYLVVGVQFEERALLRQWGEVYAGYRRRVRSLIPTLSPRGTRGVYTATARVEAPPERVWPLMADVLRWPDWLPTVTTVEPLDSPALALHARYRIVQPKLPPAVWTVVRLEPLRSFSWESRSPGVRTLADHTLSPLPDGSTSVTLRIRFFGPLSMLARAIAGSLTRQYMAREAALLKERIETNRGTA